MEWLGALLAGLKRIHRDRLAKGLLIIVGISQDDLARKYKLDKTLVSKVLMGVRKSSRIRQMIAAELDLPVEMLWPDEEVRRKRREAREKRRAYFRDSSA